MSWSVYRQMATDRTAVLGLPYVLPNTHELPKVLAAFTARLELFGAAFADYMITDLPSYAAWSARTDTCLGYVVVWNAAAPTLAPLGGSYASVNWDRMAVCIEPENTHGQSKWAIYDVHQGANFYINRRNGAIEADIHAIRQDLAAWITQYQLPSLVDSPPNGATDLIEATAPYTRFWRLATFANGSNHSRIKDEINYAMRAADAYLGGPNEMVESLAYANSLSGFSDGDAFVLDFANPHASSNFPGTVRGDLVIWDEAASAFTRWRPHNGYRTWPRAVNGTKQFNSQLLTVQNGNLKIWVGGRDAQWRISSGGATSGTFTLTWQFAGGVTPAFSGVESTTLDWFANRNDIRDALVSTGYVDDRDLDVTGGPTLSQADIFVDFRGKASGMPIALPTVNDSTDGAVSVSQTRAGALGQYLP